MGRSQCRNTVRFVHLGTWPKPTARKEKELGVSSEDGPLMRAKPVSGQRYRESRWVFQSFDMRS